MFRQIASVMFVALSLVWNLAGAGSDPRSAQADQKQDEKKSQPPSKGNTASLTGCVDEVDGHYLMLNDKREPVANLEAEGFETEGFAKHVGHKVTVRGTSNSGGARPTFRVRSIETVSETCGGAE